MKKCILNLILICCVIFTAQAQTSEKELFYKEFQMDFIKGGPADYGSSQVMKAIANNPKVKALYEEFGPTMFWIRPMNLSKASEIRIKIKISDERVKPYIIMCSLEPEERSPKVYLRTYTKSDLKRPTDVHIPISAFKTKSWNMENMCMYIVDCDYPKDVDKKDIEKDAHGGIMNTSAPVAGFESDTSNTEISDKKVE